MFALLGCLWGNTTSLFFQSFCIFTLILGIGAVLIGFMHAKKNKMIAERFLLRCSLWLLAAFIVVNLFLD